MLVDECPSGACGATPASADLRGRALRARGGSASLRKSTPGSTVASRATSAEKLRSSALLRATESARGECPRLSREERKNDVLYFIGIPRVVVWQRNDRGGYRAKAYGMSPGQSSAISGESYARTRSLPPPPSAPQDRPCPRALGRLLNSTVAAQAAAPKAFLILGVHKNAFELWKDPKEE